MTLIRALIGPCAIIAAVTISPVFAGFLGFSSAHAAMESIDPRVEDVPDFIHIPITRQATDYTCGAAALASVLHWIDSRLDFTEDKLARQLKSNRTHGTTIRNIEAFSKGLGLNVAWRDGWTIADLEGSLLRGIPVIVLIQAYADFEFTGSKHDWRNDWSNGHYVVVNGLDEKNVYMMDPSSRGTYTYIPRKEFLDRWHDVDIKVRHFNFGMTVSDPGRLNLSSYDRDRITRLQ
ncbi:MAG: hypothetical protein EBU49_10810 [Proteobacteria bacterium]|nr:hypothetical protein [Pseudomonadota bacterium]